MERRRQWRALTTERNVCAAKIGDGRDAGAIGDDLRIPDLQREWLVEFRFVADRLSVAAYGRDRCSARSGRVEQRGRRIAEALADFAMQCRHVACRTDTGIGPRGQESLAQAGRVFVLVDGNDFE